MSVFKSHSFTTVFAKRADSSSETAKGNVDEACCNPSSAAAMRGGDAAFARAVRDASQGGQCKAPCFLSERLQRA